jgi:hypothetical protein
MYNIHQERIGIMALSNAERQERYRQSQKAKGLVRKTGWIDREGFLADFKDKYGDRPRISLRKFSRELNKITAAINLVYAEEIYAELLEHAKRLQKGYERMENLVDNAVAKEKKSGRWE